MYNNNDRSLSVYECVLCSKQTTHLNCHDWNHAPFTEESIFGMQTNYLIIVISRRRGARYHSTNKRKLSILVVVFGWNIFGSR